MNAYKRFCIGGGGALMPVLVSLLAIDIGALLASDAALSTGHIVGMGIRYLILFILGGVVAYLHEDEVKPFKLFELGIAAPALITSLITAQGVVGSTGTAAGLTEETVSIQFSLINSAHADSFTDSKPQYIAGFFKDVIHGASGGIYKDMKESQERKAVAPSTEDEPRSDSSRSVSPRSISPRTSSSGDISTGSSSPVTAPVTIIHSNQAEVLLPVENMNLMRARLQASKEKAQRAENRMTALESKLKAAEARVKVLQQQYQVSVAETLAAKEVVSSVEALIRVQHNQ